jgi:hypothetical protein
VEGVSIWRWLVCENGESPSPDSRPRRTDALAAIVVPRAGGDAGQNDNAWRGGDEAGLPGDLTHGYRTTTLTSLPGT